MRNHEDGMSILTGTDTYKQIVGTYYLSMYYSTLVENFSKLLYSTYLVHGLEALKIGPSLFPMRTKAQKSSAKGSGI